MYCEERFQHVSSYDSSDTKPKILTIEKLAINKVIRSLQQQDIKINSANSRVLFRFTYTGIDSKPVFHETMAPLTTKFYLQPLGGITGYLLSAPSLELEMLDYVPPQPEHDHCISEVRLGPRTLEAGICYRFTFQGDGAQGDEQFRKVKKVIDEYHHKYQYGDFSKLRITKATKKDRELFGLKSK